MQEVLPIDDAQRVGRTGVDLHCLLPDVDSVVVEAGLSRHRVRPNRNINYDHTGARESSRGCTLGTGRKSPDSLAAGCPSFVVAMSPDGALPVLIVSPGLCDVGSAASNIRGGTGSDGGGIIIGSGGCIGGCGGGCGGGTITEFGCGCAAIVGAASALLSAA